MRKRAEYPNDNHGGHYPRERRVRLKTAAGHDLDMYVFNDDVHAVEWLSQEWVETSGYKVEIISARKRQCCGALYAIIVVEQLTPSEFLARMKGEQSVAKD